VAQTVANLTDVLKEAWTSERIEKQFYDENPVFDRLTKVEATMIGEKAIVPIHKGRNGGYTSTNAAGGNLNTAGEQRVDAAEYTLVYHWLPIELEAAALTQAGGSNLQSVIASKDLEMQGAIEDLKHNCSRQLVMDGTGRIAQCDDGGASTTVELLASGLGYDALVRGWLQPGMRVDIGTTADSDSLATGSLISAMKVDSADPDITIADSITTVAATGHWVSIANPNSATTTNPELNGFRNIISTTESLGGLDPQTAGEEFWSAGALDTTSTVMTVNLANSLARGVQQNSGSASGEVFTSLKQRDAWYELLQNQVRFASDSVNAGSDSPKYRGMVVNGLPQVPDRDWHYVTLKDLCLITGSIKKPTWATDLAGTGGGLQYVPGTTGFKNSVVFPFQVGATRRNTHSSATALTA
jgi:hypothetical protein